MNTWAGGGVYTGRGTSGVTNAFVEPLMARAEADESDAGFAARVAEKPLEESLKIAVAAGAASTLEVGAGRFEPKEASRLQSSVHVRVLEPVAG